GLEEIGSLSMLEDLWIDGVQIPESLSVIDWAKLTRLRRLSMNARGNSLDPLGVLKSLETLRISNGPEDLSALAQLIGLKELHVGGISENAPNLDFLNNMSLLEELGLEKMKIADAGLEKISQMKFNRL